MKKIVFAHTPASPPCSYPPPYVNITLEADFEDGAPNGTATFTVRAPANEDGSSGATASFSVPIAELVTSAKEFMEQLDG